MKKPHTRMGVRFFLNSLCEFCYHKDTPVK